MRRRVNTLILRTVDCYVLYHVDREIPLRVFVSYMWQNILAFTKGGAR